LCGCCAGRPVSFHDTVPLTLVPPRHPLERGWRHSQKGYDHLLYTHRGRRRDVRPAGWVSPVTSGLVRPSPRHCAAIPGTTASSLALWEPRSTAHCHTRRCAASDLLSADPSNRRTDDDQARAPATTLEAAPGRAQDPRRCPPEARFAWTTVNSTTLCIMLPHVALRTVRHDCKPPPLGL
jgi:hypothetical protein